MQLEQHKISISDLYNYRNAVLQLLDNLLEKEEIDLKEYKINFSNLVNSKDIGSINQISKELTAKYINV